MNVIAVQIWQLIWENKAAISVAAVWFVREWTTFGGASGIWSWIKTGSTTPTPKNTSQPQTEQPK